MGSSNYYNHRTGPCANCGREGGGFMGSSCWGHGHMCCGHACGKRLAHKLANGMGGPRGDDMLPFDGMAFGDPADRALDLRIRIKQLAHRAKAAAAPQAPVGGVLMDDLETISRALKMFEALAGIGEQATSMQLRFKRTPEEYRERMAAANRALANLAALTQPAPSSGEAGK